MKRFTLLVVVAALALTGCSAHTPPPVPERVQQYYNENVADGRVPQKVELPPAVFIGDSWVGGSEMGGNGWRNFSYILAGRMGWRFVDNSKGGSGYVRAAEPMGNFSSDMRMDKVKEVQPTYTFVVNGINDWQEEISADQLRDAAAMTYDKIFAAAPKTRLLVIGMMAPGG